MSLTVMGRQALLAIVTTGELIVGLVSKIEVELFQAEPASSEHTLPSLKPASRTSEVVRYKVVGIATSLTTPQQVPACRRCQMGAGV